VRDARHGIVAFLEQSAEAHVYWIERTGKAQQFFSINAAPIDIAPVLSRMIFRPDCCCVMTSATLAVGQRDLAYFRRRVGALGADPLQLGSPFDFKAQMKLFVVQKMPTRAMPVTTPRSPNGSRISWRRRTVARSSFSPATAACSSSRWRWSRSSPRNA
jgi:ATP-dependent DNA helicase DinG